MTDLSSALYTSGLGLRTKARKGVSKAMGKGMDYIVTYEHMEVTARLMDVEAAINRGDRDAAAAAVQRAQEAARETATLIERWERAQANDR